MIVSAVTIVSGTIGARIGATYSLTHAVRASGTMAQQVTKLKESANYKGMEPKLQQAALKQFKEAFTKQMVYRLYSGLYGGGIVAGLATYKALESLFGKESDK
jgi:hypothetical protein